MATSLKNSAEESDRLKAEIQTAEEKHGEERGSLEEIIEDLRRQLQEALEVINFRL